MHKYMIAKCIALAALMGDSLVIAQTVPGAAIAFSPAAPTPTDTITALLNQQGCGGGIGTVVESTISIYSPFGCPAIVPPRNPQSATFGPLAAGTYQVTWYVGYPPLGAIATATLVVNSANGPAAAPFLKRGALGALALMLTAFGVVALRLSRKSA